LQAALTIFNERDESSASDNDDCKRILEDAYRRWLIADRIACAFGVG
jgi:hypothetical protein